MDLPDASFDVAILHLILSVVLDPVRCIREVARVLKQDGRVIVFDKFMPDAKRPPLIFRLVNPLLSILGTEITRQLGPILQASGLAVTHEEPAGGGGILKIVILKKLRTPPSTFNEESPQ
jgi:phosphatidylethanolamine/phosphatidyl-N-methylethanolamine N-methyltransferase